MHVQIHIHAHTYTYNSVSATNKAYCISVLNILAKDIVYVQIYQYLYYIPHCPPSTQTQGTPEWNIGSCVTMPLVFSIEQVIHNVDTYHALCDMFDPVKKSP